jgi:hypothetical protein
VPRRCALAAASIFALAVLVPAAGLAQLEPRSAGPVQQVQLELVLAVDTSSSVSPEEFDLQMRGFATAFRSPEVIAAIAATGRNGVAVTMIQWSDNRRQQVAIEWRLLVDEASILELAGYIDGTPRFLDGGGAAIGGAIEFAMQEIENNAYDGLRKVIDISGDGRANQGAQPDSLRDLAVLQGITINGLAILNEDSSVAGYYRSSVIGGSGAFVMTANDYESFAAAMLQKLIKEIGGVPIAQGPGEGPAQGQGDPPAARLSQGAGTGGPRMAQVWPDRRFAGD